MAQKTNSSPSVGRAVRIAKGLASPETRPRYVAALKRKLGVGSAPPAKEPTAAVCMICGGRAAKSHVVYHKDPEKAVDVEKCSGCGYVAIPRNFKDYLQYTSLDKFPMTTRVGTPEHPGREYWMAEMGVEILGHSEIEILLYGTGASTDFMHAEKLPGVRRVMITDIQDVHGLPNFVDTTQLRSDQYDLLIACEVVEHFTDPIGDFKAMLKFLKPGGMAICSTNIYDGGDLTKHNYMFIKGHTSYYTPKAIQRIARENGLFVDFRMPTVATGFAGPRKRYVFLTQSPERLQDVARYFGKHMFAPAES